MVQFTCPLCKHHNPARDMREPLRCDACANAFRMTDAGIIPARNSTAPDTRTTFGAASVAQATTQEGPAMPGFVKNFVLKSVYGLAAGIVYAVAVGFEHAATVPFPGDPLSIPAQVYGPILVALSTGAAATLKRAVSWLQRQA